jgi:hypothetical protein
MEYVFRFLAAVPILLLLFCNKTSTQDLLSMDFLDEPKVQDVLVKNLESYSVTLSWSALPPGNSVAELSTSATFQSVAFTSGQVTGLSYTFTGLTAQTTYYYRVRTKDSKGRFSRYAPNPVDSFTTPVNLDPSIIRRSCKELHDLFPAYADGEYTIDSDGSGPNSPFVVYCDMTFSDGVSAGGWTLVLAYNDNQGSLLSTDTPPAKVTRGLNKKDFMPMSRLEPLAKVSTQVAIRTYNSLPNSYIVSKSDTAPIRNLTDGGAGSSLNVFPGLTTTGKIDQVWIRGSSIAASQLTATCLPLDYAYPESIHHPCGNAGGLHFIPRNSQGNWIGGAAAGLNMELLVR